MGDLKVREEIKLGYDRTDTHIIKWATKNFGLGASFSKVKEFKDHMGESWEIPTCDQLDILLRTIGFKREVSEYDVNPSNIWTCEFEVITKDFECGGACTCDGTEICVGLKYGEEVECFRVYNLRDEEFKVENPYNYISNWGILVNIREVTKGA
jgi:hypothetical protein